MYRRGTRHVPIFGLGRSRKKRHARARALTDIYQEGRFSSHESSRSQLGARRARVRAGAVSRGARLGADAARRRAHRGRTFGVREVSISSSLMKDCARVGCRLVVLSRGVTFPEGLLCWNSPSSESGWKRDLLRSSRYSRRMSSRGRSPRCARCLRRSERSSRPRPPCVHLQNEQCVSRASKNALERSTYAHK